MNKYFYIDKQGTQKGPFNLSDLRKEPIDKHTYVWTEGMNEWQLASEVRALDFLFSGSAGYYSSGRSASEPPSSIDQPSKCADMAPDVPMPKSWLTQSILVTLLPFILCGSTFSLLGIIAIINAAKVESLYLAGNLKESFEAAGKAKKWTYITFWISIGWVIILVLIIIFALAFAFFGFSSISNAMLSACTL